MPSKITLNTVKDTRKWAAEFAKTLHAPVTVALHGDLGMGKSEIARTIIQTLCGCDTTVPSPTFTIVQEYTALCATPIGGAQISHFDLYRITDESELEEIGLRHACDNNITLIEWPEIATGILPPDTIHIYIAESESGGRKIKILKS